MKVRQSEEFAASIGSQVHLSFPRQWLKLYVDEFLVQEQQ
jgi:glycerol transport system ATP-binding protein